MAGRLYKRWFASHRLLFQACYDCACWVAALLFAMWLRYDLDVDRVRFGGLLHLVPVIVAAQVVAGLAFGLYRGQWQYGSFDEVLALFKGVAFTGGLVYTTNILSAPFLVPRSTPIVGGLAALFLMGGGRYLWRLLDERRRRPHGPGLERLLVFGAGRGGTQIIRAMLSNPDSRYLPVAVLDDSPSRRRLRICHVPVVGGRDQMAEAALSHRADALLIAIPSADAPLVTELSELALAAGLPVKVLPPVADLIECSVELGDIRDVAAEDLLGRHEIRTDVASIAGYLAGKRVLVTGAGGSIGSELCRQIYRFAPAELIMVDHDESALHAVSLSMDGRANLDSDDLVLLDVRDRAGIERLFACRRPEVVFHAAALKHLPILERHPAEAVRTNVWATLNLLEVAVAARVERFVNISTDKAADPCSVLGYTKRISERLTAHLSAAGPTVAMSVRFGNVLGSRGSVLTTFQSQIERGGPLTVTHPDVTRYFMTVEEAIELVIQAGAIGGRGEVMVLDMGVPVRIADVAEILAARAPRRVSIQYTGLRGGEKLHEVLLGSDEEDCRPRHPMISQVAVAGLEPMCARLLTLDVPDADIRRQLAELCASATAVTVAED